MMRLACVLLALSLVAAAERVKISPYVEGNIGAGNLGYDNPSSEFGAGVEFDYKNWMVDLNGAFSPTDKSYVGDGNSANTNLHIFRRLNGGLLLGGGGSCSKTWTSQYQKAGCKPRASVGWQGLIDGQLIRMTADYVFNGTDYRNRVNGVALTTIIGLGPRFALVYEFGGYRFHDTDLPDQKHVGGITSAGLRYRF